MLALKAIHLLEKMNLEKNNLFKNNESKNSKFNFSQKKENTICSLFEVEKFLGDFKNIWKYIKLYKILK